MKISTTRFLFTLMAVSFISSTFSQAPNWLWANSPTGGTDTDRGSAVAIDASGNAYVVGYFKSNTVTFGSITLTNASASFSQDAFLVKYNAAGTVVWAKRIGGTDNDVANGVCVDATGNVYVIGNFASTSLYGFANANPTTNDLFIAKYSSSGSLLNSATAGGTGNEDGQAIGVNTAGDVYITGTNGSVPSTFGSFTLNNPGFFIAKFNSTFVTTWAKDIGNNNAIGKALSVDPSGNVLITGYSSGQTLVFGSTTLTNVNSLNDAFVAKFDSNGNALWAKEIAGSADELAYCINTDALGNVYTGGAFTSPTCILGSTTLTNSTASTHDLYFAKYNSAGVLQWATRAGGAGTERAYGIGVDNSSNVYLTGLYTSSTITFGSTILTNVLVNKTDFFITKYNTSGTVLWAKSAGSSGDDIPYGIATDAIGNCYLTGRYTSPTCTFGSTTLTNAASGLDDIFVAKLDVGATGVSSLDAADSEIRVYPNPTNGIITVETNYLPSVGDNESTITLTNVLGQTVLSSQQRTLSSELNISELPNGIYFIKIGTVTKKIIKQ